jgi:hypothetical protein
MGNANDEAAAIATRLAPVIVELGMSWVHADGDVRSQLIGIQTALVIVASRLAGVISKQYGTDISVFAKIASEEFARVAATAQASGAMRH